MASVGTKYKSKLIERINSIQDKNILDEVNRLLEVDVEDSIYKTSSEQKQEIDKARLQLSQNKGIPSEEADREIEKWLTK
ncbi:hypothetical protein [Reichenbachiella sp.]|uniref:hypothetical protein n=1 Tax=Reichenbachiella sp. TaxID=2184521 RepID=UPI003BB08071